MSNQSTVVSSRTLHFRLSGNPKMAISLHPDDRTLDYKSIHFFFALQSIDSFIIEKKNKLIKDK